MANADFSGIERHPIRPLYAVIPRESGEPSIPQRLRLLGRPLSRVMTPHGLCQAKGSSDIAPGHTHA